MTRARIWADKDLARWRYYIDPHLMFVSIDLPSGRERGVPTSPRLALIFNMLLTVRDIEVTASYYARRYMAAAERQEFAYPEYSAHEYLWVDRAINAILHGPCVPPRSRKRVIRRAPALQELRPRPKS